MSDHSKDHPAFRLKDFLNPRSYYWQTRQWHLLRHGAPAVVISLLILVPVFSYPLMRKGSVERYTDAFNQAVRQQQFETANLFLQKLDSLPDREEENELRFNRAIVALGRGRSEEAVAKMRELAPDNEYGYGPAHLWLAQKYITVDPTISGENATTIVHHLESALRANNENETLRLALGHYYYRTNNPANAIKHLALAVEKHPELHFVLANLHDSVGDAENAKDYFQRAADHLETQLKNHPEQVETRVNLAIAQSKSGLNFSQVIKTLLAGVDSASPDPLLRNTLSQFYLAESDRLRQSSSPNDPKYKESLEMLSKALDAAPNNDAAVNRIAEIASLGGAAATEAAGVLKKLVAEGKMMATAHVILGTIVLQQGDTERAKRHYGQAYLLDPQMPALLNNVAWVLSHEDPPQLEKALGIISTAIEKADPKNRTYPYMLDTRGQIYVQMQRWDEALVDLERALTDMAENPNVHKGLATTYSNLGEAELAREHEELARKYKVNN